MCSLKPKSNCHNLLSPQAFNTWIDDLVEFKETTLPDNMSQMSITEALYKLEADKDIPSIQLIKYDGNPLTYVEFIERFKLLIHDKPHLSDDVRMAQLKNAPNRTCRASYKWFGIPGNYVCDCLKEYQRTFWSAKRHSQSLYNKVSRQAKNSNLMIDSPCKSFCSMQLIAWRR